VFLSCACSTERRETKTLHGDRGGSRSQEEEERGETRGKPEELDRIIIATVSGGCSRSKQG
jgi:hypothetical protein